MDDFSALEKRTRLALYSIVEQANEIEFYLNDILAWDYFNVNSKVLSELDYLSYIETQLQTHPLASKCRKAANIIAEHNNYSKAQHECLVHILDKWRRVRNCVAHGILVINSSQIPVVYHNGICYKIDSLERAFFRINGVLIRILSTDSIKLRTPYSNKYPLSSRENDPDHPGDWTS